MSSVIRTISYLTALSLVLFLSPAGIALAQRVTLETVIGKITNLIALVIPIAFALAILFFFWGIAKFIYFADNEPKRAEGKNILLWGVIAIFVLVSIWGIVALLEDAFFGGASIRSGPSSSFLDIGPNPFEVNPIIDCTDPINAQNQFCRDVRRPNSDIGPNPFNVNPVIDCSDPQNAGNQFCRDVN